MYARPLVLRLRRHLDDSQRGMVGARIATLRLGDNQHTKEGTSIEVPSQPAAAKLLNVSLSTVQRAAVVLQKGAPELQAAVDAGVLSVSVAGMPACQCPCCADERAKGTQGQGRPPLGGSLRAPPKDDAPTLADLVPSAGYHGDPDEWRPTASTAEAIAGRGGSSGTLPLDSRN